MNIKTCRQDAVMVQLFGLVNTLLRETPEARARDLRMGSFRVIPFTPSAGMVEWIENTLPLGDWLVNGQRPAHLRYRPKDWSSSAVFKTLSEKDLPNKERKTRYIEVCDLVNASTHVHNYIHTDNRPYLRYCVFSTGMQAF
jgi:ataxia telangiectasia mutated family protein